MNKTKDEVRIVKNYKIAQEVNLLMIGRSREANQSMPRTEDFFVSFIFFFFCFHAPSSITDFTNLFRF